MGLFDIFKKKKKVSKNSVGESMDRLEPDGELPFGWLYYNKQFTSQQEKKIDDMWKFVYSAKTTQIKLDAFREYLDTVTKVGEFCKKTGECHYKWFCEYILGSQWYNDQVRDYRKLKAEAPYLIKRDMLLETLESDVMEKLCNCEGVLQSDFIKMFDPLIKSDVSSFLYEADKSGKIKRTKSGRSYILEILK